MVIQSLKLLIVLALVISVPLVGFAQNSPSSSISQDEGPRPGGPRRQLATIIFAGLGGAILGLSTLSFYGRPQDNLSNIAVGFAVGVIAGTGYVTYKAATSPQDFYGTKPWLEENGGEPGSLSVRGDQNASPPMKIGWAFEF